MSHAELKEEKKKKLYKASFYNKLSADSDTTKSGKKFDEKGMTFAVPQELYDEFKGKKFRFTNPANNKSIEAVGTDSGNLKKYGRDFDLTEEAFKAIADPEQGLVDVTIEDLGHGEAGIETKEDIMEYQKALKDKGYYEGEIDGKRGQDTVNSIRKFQQENELVPDADVGEKTKGKLFGDIISMLNPFGVKEAAAEEPTKLFKKSELGFLDGIDLGAAPSEEPIKPKSSEVFFVTIH